APFRDRRVADEVGEEDRYQPSFRDRLQRRRAAVPRLRCKRSPALAAELDAGRVGRAALGTGAGERGAALAAELPAGLVVGAAGGAAHRLSVSLENRITTARRASPTRRRAPRPSRSRACRTGGAPGCRARR